MHPLPERRTARSRPFVALACAGLLAGCGEGIRNGPIQPASPYAVARTDGSFRPLAFRLPATEATRAARLSPVRVSEVISAEQGGQLLLDWELKDDGGATLTRVRVELKVHPGALERDSRLSITLTNPSYAMVEVDLKFGEEGTEFLKPAEVSLHFQGLDLSDQDSADDIDLFFYDRRTKTWYRVPNEFKEVDLAQGSVRGLWYIKHFSRYSLSDGGDP